MRLRDRFFDLYVNVPLGKVVTDKLRPPGRNDPHGVEEAKALLRTSLDMIEQDMAQKS
jgi:glutathione S-transferase